MGLEIERKYRVISLGDLPLENGKPIDQGYLSEGGPTVRVRTVGPKGFLTIKSSIKEKQVLGGAIHNLEFEYEIPFEDALELLKIARYRLRKTRYYLKGGVEIDIFHDRHEGLILAEFESEDGSHPEPLPGVVWEEVSGDKRYTNSSIARNGMPEAE